MAGFFSRKQYAAIADRELAIRQPFRSFLRVFPYAFFLAETAGMKQDKNTPNPGIVHAVGLVAT